MSIKHDRNHHCWSVRAFVGALMVCTLFLTVFSAPLLAGTGNPRGKISGHVSDSKTGEALIGVSIFLEGTEKGAITDVDGNYLIKDVPVGSHSLRCQMVGYSTFRIEEINVKDGEITELNFHLEGTVHDLDKTIVVKAKAVQNTQATMLLHRKAAKAVTDAISSEEISRSGSGDAAQAMTKVVGASVVDGRYVYIRGLGDRYTNTQLDGSPLPSPDPKKQGAHMDLIPAGLLDNIVVSKSFTPDKPGDFAGGSVNLATKDYPEKRTLNVSSSFGHNSATTGELVMTHTAGSKNWLGYNDGTYDIPGAIASDFTRFTDVQKLKTTYILDSIGDSDKANMQLRNDLNNSLKPELVSGYRRAPVNQSYSITYGDQVPIFGRPLGVTATLNYTRDFSNQAGYEGDFSRASYGNYDIVYDMTRTKATENVLWGTLISARFGIHPNHKLGYRLVFNRNGEMGDLYLYGIRPGTDSELSHKIRTWALTYNERKLESHQFSGEHSVAGNKVFVDWKYAFANTTQNDPDQRYFADVLNPGGGDTTYAIETGLDHPKRAWREINVDQRSYDLNMTVPLAKHTQFKTGFAYSKEEAGSNELSIEYTADESYDGSVGDPNRWASQAGIMRVDTFPATSRRPARVVYTFGTQFSIVDNEVQDYSGDKRITGGYGMLEFNMPYMQRLRFIGGARYEDTKYHVSSYDVSSGSRVATIAAGDWLPSVNAVYALTEKMNLRSSYARTVARPAIRELTSSKSYEFGGGPYFIGNPDLKQSRIDNYDLRIEWFPRPGEVFAASLFYKEFTYPIELTAASATGYKGDQKPQNIDFAKVRGVEFEFRSRLDRVWHKLAAFSMGGNLSLIKSKASILEEELNDIRIDFPGAKDWRPMIGQAPYIINMDASYELFKSGTAFSVYYNRLGRRLVLNSASTTPDVYEYPRDQVDFFFTQRVFQTATFKFSVKNVLNRDVILMYHDDLAPEGEQYDDHAYSKYSPGVTYSFGISYDIL